MGFEENAHYDALIADVALKRLHLIIMNVLSRQRRKVHTEQAPLMASESSRVAAIILDSRSKLRPMAEKKNASGKWLNDNAGKHGALDGIGMLLRFAAIEVEPDGTVTEQNLTRFQQEATAILAQLENIALNFSVLSSLFLTIFVALAIQHAGAPAYAKAAAEDDDAFAVISPFGDGPTDGIWNDFAGFAWPNDAIAQRKLRRSLYVGECVTLTLAIYVCLWGLVQQLLMFTSYGAALPNVIVKVEFMMEKLSRLTDIWISFDAIVILFLPLGLAFVAARVSAVACICGFALVAANFVTAAIQGMIRGVCPDILFCQHKEAQTLLARGMLEPRL